MSDLVKEILLEFGAPRQPLRITLRQLTSDDDYARCEDLGIDYKKYR